MIPAVDRSTIDLSSSVFGDQSWVIPNRSDSPDYPKAAIPSAGLSYVSKCETSSGHSVDVMEIRTASGNKRVYFKKCDYIYPHHSAQCEAAISADYRLVLGNQAAKMRPVIDLNEDVIGSISYEIPNFVPMEDIYLNAAQMIEMGIAEELVARGFREESDLHSKNIGVSNNKICGIDYDESYYSVMYEIKGKRIIINPLSLHPSEAFQITRKYIEEFPKIEGPCHWPTNIPDNGNPFKVFKNRQEFLQLSKDPMFNLRKNRAFLKELLLEPSVHFKVMEPYFAIKDVDAQQYFSKIKKCIEKKWLELESVLIEDANFRKFIFQNKQALQDCLDWFQQYNDEIAENDVIMDLSSIRERYIDIIKKCLVKELEASGIKFDVCLTENATFRKFILHSKQIFHNCIESFKKFNDEVFQEGVIVDLSSIHQRYLDIVKLCMVKDITLAIYDLGYGLNNDEKEWIQFKALYQRLIDCFLRFQKNINVFSQAFIELELEYNNLVPSDVANYSWVEKCKNLSTIIDNYRGFTDQESSMVKSIFLRHSVDNSSVSKKVYSDAPSCLAKTLHNFLINQKNKEKIISIAKESFEAYKPLGYETGVGNYNPMNYFRARTPEFENLFSNLNDSNISQFPFLIKNFISTGAWNVPYVRGASANVLLISKLCQASLDAFRQRVSLKQLKKYNLFEVSYALKSGDCKLENLAQEISEKFASRIIR